MSSDWWFTINSCVHVSSVEDPIETEVKGMLTIICIISRLPECSKTPIGLPMSIAQFWKVEIPKE